MNDLLNNLSNRVWITRGCRFNAQRRMEINDKCTNLSISVLSVIIIAINLLVFLPYFNNGNIITIITVSLSVFVLSISQFVYARDYKIKAQNYHKCGCELSEILDKIEILKMKESIQGDEISNLYKEYEKVIISYNENHSDIDYEIFRAMNRKDKSNNPKDNRFQLSLGKVCWIKLKWYTTLYFKYVFLDLILPTASVFAVFCLK